MGQKRDHDMLLGRLEGGVEFIKERLVYGTKRMENQEVRTEEVNRLVNVRIDKLIADVDRRVRPLEAYMWKGMGALAIITILVSVVTSVLVNAMR